MRIETMTQSGMRYHLLDPLRGLAALAVFVFHFRFSESFQSAFPLLHRLFKFGDRGVPVFFVISGYCLSVSALGAIKRSQSPGQFLLRRAKRIYPTFWYSVVFIVVSHLLFVEFWEATRGSMPRFLANRFSSYDWFDWLKILSLTQIFDRDFGIWFARFGRINGAYWTLAIELQFYAVMAVALIRPRWFFQVLGAVSLLSIPAYLSRYLFAKTAGAGLFLPYWSWFALGILLCEMLRRDITPERVLGSNAKTIAGSLILAGATVTLLLVLNDRLEDRLFFACLFTAFLWLAHPWCCVRMERYGLMGRGLLVLGSMSYSLYLIHNQVSQLLRMLGGRWIDQGVLFDVLVVVGTCLLCYPFYRYCEAPIVASMQTRVRASEVKDGDDEHSGEERKSPELLRAA